MQKTYLHYLSKKWGAAQAAEVAGHSGTGTQVVMEAAGGVIGGIVGAEKGGEIGAAVGSVGGPAGTLIGGLLGACIGAY